MSKESKKVAADLRKLADFIEKLPEYKFDMHSWGQDTKTGSPYVEAIGTQPHMCSTAGCIGGWGTVVFPRRLVLIGGDLYLRSRVRDITEARVNYRARPVYRPYKDVSSALGIAEQEATRLCDPSIEDNGDLTIKEAASNIRALAAKYEAKP